MTTTKVRFTISSSGKVTYTHNILKLALDKKNLLDCPETILFYARITDNTRVHIYTRALVDGIASSKTYIFNTICT